VHVLLDGTVRVVRADGETIARRGAGEAVGEMSKVASGPCTSGIESSRP
jgi:hypothetical protein